MESQVGNLSGSCLTCQTICNYKGTMSEKQSVTIGVPQGSILGNLLFIIFMNDAPEVVKQILDLCADDITL